MTIDQQFEHERAVLESAEFKAELQRRGGPGRRAAPIVPASRGGEIEPVLRKCRRQVSL